MYLNFKFMWRPNGDDRSLKSPTKVADYELPLQLWWATMHIQKGIFSEDNDNLQGSVTENYSEICYCKLLRK
jgi:hypothetical protein